MEQDNYLRVGYATDIKNPRDRRIYRALEILPGFLAWFTIGLIILLSYLTPVFISIFIIIFDIYWMVKTIFLSVHMRSSFNKMRGNLKINWLEKLENLPFSDYQLAYISNWKELYHLIVLPMANEPLEVVRHSFQGLVKAHYPLDKFIVVLATEERVGESAQTIAKAIQEEFGDKFFKFLITTHPADLPNEIIGKGSNETWAGNKAKNMIDGLGIAYEKIITSVFDVDTVTPHGFFACLSWNYLTAGKPLRSSFQPIPLFTNNIWYAPAFARVFAFSTTFWQMIQQARPEQLVTFSSQSISFKALVEIGFWQQNVVSEDSRIYWQCLLHYDGDWRTVPMHYPVYMDANVASTFWQTVKNQYKQIRRWHFGVENNPYFLFGFLKNKKIPRRLKIFHTFNMVEKAHSSASNAIIIFLLGWLPLFLGGVEFNRTVLSFNLPRLTRELMTLTMFGLVTSAILSVIMLPPKPAEYGRWKWVMMIGQWILFPINFIFFGAIPALDAQTRLMFGKYLGFWVTPKSRKAHSK